MTTPVPQRLTNNQHFRYAQNGIHRLHFALNTGNYLQGVERHLTDVLHHTVEGWLQLRFLPYPQYQSYYEIVEYFRSNAPTWLADFHRNATGLWIFCEDEYAGMGYFDEPEVTLDAEEFKAMLQVYLHNAILLYGVMERSALDVEYVASAEELALKKWSDPRYTS